MYLKTDVLLLCDVFQKLINVCLKDYRLDPWHYFSSPGLSWDAMLKMTGIKLEMISNINIHLFIVNNLYEWTMIRDLPYEGFKFLNEEEVKRFDLDSISENSKIGYILEVDLEYCWKLHDVHNDYPLCPEHIGVK